MFLSQGIFCQGKTHWDYKHSGNTQEKTWELWHFVEQTSECYMYIYAHIRTYIFTPNTTFFHYWFLFILPKVAVHNWNSGFQSITQSSTHISINNKSYYNKCNLSCSLFTFPFFNCMFSFFQLCVIDLRWRLQRKTSL